MDSISGGQNDADIPVTIRAVASVADSEFALSLCSPCRIVQRRCYCLDKFRSVVQ